MENHDTAWLDLADAVTALRNQLAEAQRRGAGDPIRLGISEITMQFGLELVRSAKGDGGLRFGVVSVGAGGEHARKATHTVSLKLSAYGDDGSPVDIGDDEP
jgi:hypothetical protein